MNQLVEDYFLLACKIAHRWAHSYPWLASDFVSDAGLALWKAARRYDPTTVTITFAACVRVVVRRACWQRVLSERRKNPAAFQPQPQVRDDAGELLDQVAGDEPEPGAELEAADELADLFGRAGLTEIQRGSLVRHVAGGETQTAIAAERGVDHSSTSAAIGTALAKLRAAAQIET